MPRIIQKFIVTALLAIFAAQANAMFIQPDWWDPNQPGVGTNRYTYSHGDPINKSDRNGHDSFGSGNPYSGYDTDNDGFAKFVGGWDYDYNTDIGVRNPYNDPQNKGGGDDFQATYPSSMSYGERTAGIANTFSQGTHPNFGIFGETATQHGTWPVGSNKCNCFTAVVVGLAGIEVPNVYAGYSIPRFIGGHAPTAADWANGNLRGFSPVRLGEYRLGDVIGAEGNFGDATGHTGIVTGVDPDGNVTSTAYAYGTRDTRSGGGIKSSNWGSPEYKENPNPYFNWGGARAR